VSSDYWVSEEDEGYKSQKARDGVQNEDTGHQARDCARESLRTPLRIVSGRDT
jgi:hypothetical protein